MSNSIRRSSRRAAAKNAIVEDIVSNRHSEVGPTRHSFAVESHCVQRLIINMYSHRDTLEHAKLLSDTFGGIGAYVRRYRHRLTIVNTYIP